MKNLNQIVDSTTFVLILKALNLVLTGIGLQKEEKDLLLFPDFENKEIVLRFLKGRLVK